jgi:hypothetical protein
MFRAATAGIDTTPHVMQILGIEGGQSGDEEEEAERSMLDEERRR